MSFVFFTFIQKFDKFRSVYVDIRILNCESVKNLNALINYQFADYGKKKHSVRSFVLVCGRQFRFNIKFEAE